MGFVNSAKKGVFWTFLQQFSVTLINFGVQILLARLLIPSDFGLIAMISIFIAIGQTLTDSGMTSSLIRGKNNTEEDYGTVFLANIGISTLTYIIVFCVSPFVSEFYKQPILTDLLRFFSLVFVFNAFNAVQLAKFSKELDFKSQFTFQLPSVIIGAIVGVFFALKGKGVWSLVWVNVSQSLSFSLIIWLFYTWRPKMIFNKELFKHHFNFGYKLTLSGILNTGYLNLYKIIIGKVYSPTNVGYFTQADSLRLFPVNQLSSILNKVTFPLFASIADDSIKLRNAYISSMRIVISLSSSMMILLILIANPLFLIVFGEKWLPSVPYFQILCIASIFLPIGTYNLNILKVKGRSDLFFRVEVIKKVIGVVALICSIPFGIKTMVWTLCITNVFFAFLNGYFSGRFIDYTVVDQLFNSSKVVVTAIIPAIIIYFLERFLFVQIEIGVFERLLLISLLYLILFIPLVFIFNKELIIDLKKIIKK